uniref:Large ribosomal subunit protein uL15m n=1 Tax=Acrobeloides nanus TaxID=290746 RepID=A0A914EN10_9BILA
MYLLVFLLIVPCVVGLDGQFSNIICSRTTELKTDNLPSQLLPKISYEITTRTTDWVTNKTAKLVEYFYDKDQTNIVTKSDVNGQQTWIINGSNVISFQGDKCYNETTNINPYNISSIMADFLGHNITSLSDIINAIINSKRFNLKGLNYTSVTAGVNTVGWVGCAFDVTGDNTTGVQVLVSFAGDHSFSLYNPTFKNPLVYNVHFYVFKESENDNSQSTILEHSSMDFVTMDIPDDLPKIRSLLLDGIYCENMTSTLLPFNFPSRFEASFQFTDSTGKTIDTVQLMFDQGNHIVAYSLDFSKDRDVPLVGTATLDSGIAKATIIHDFNYGLQYVLNRNAHVCHQSMPIDIKMGDVKVQNNTFSLKEPDELILGIASQEFYYAGKFDLQNLNVERYVSKKSLDNDEHIVIEVDLLPSEWSFDGNNGHLLHSVTQYHKNKNGEIRKTILRMSNFVNNTIIGTSWNKYNIEPCIETSENNLFYILLNKINMTGVRHSGYENVASSIVEAVAKAGNVSLLRVAHPLLKKYGDGVMAIFLLADKSKVSQPTKTVYFKEELSVDEVVANLNKTVSTSAISVSVMTEELKKIEFHITEFGILPDHYTPPAPTPHFQPGYSGSSMFILGLFMFIFAGVDFFNVQTCANLNIKMAKNLKSVSEKALQYVEKASRIRLQDLRDNPGARVSGRQVKKWHNQAGHTIGQLQRAAKPPLGWIWGDWFKPWQRVFPGEEHFNGDINLRREYIPISLLELQRMIDLRRLDTSRLIDIAGLCGTKLFAFRPEQRQFGIHLTGEGAEIFAAKINLEVQWADQTTIAAVERAGGRIRTAYYDLESLRAAVDPEKWFRSGKPIPPRKYPPHTLMPYYIDPNNRGYLAKPEDIAKSEQRLAEIVGYQRQVDPSDEENWQREQKNPKQVFLGLEPGSIVSLEDRKVFVPTHPVLTEYYNGEPLADHLR